MRQLEVPNKTEKCYAPFILVQEPIDYILDKCILRSAKGGNQTDVAFQLREFGYILNDPKIKTLDNYITRVQKRIEDEINVYGQFQVKIYYGKIGLNNEFGYYIYVHK
jgi:hypothetical protein